MLFLGSKENTLFQLSLEEKENFLFHVSGFKIKQSEEENILFFHSQKSREIFSPPAERHLPAISIEDADC